MKVYKFSSTHLLVSRSSSIPLHIQKFLRHLYQLPEFSEFLERKLRAENQHHAYRFQEMPLILSLVEMESRGIAVNTDAFQEVKQDLIVRIRNIEYESRKLLRKVFHLVLSRGHKTLSFGSHCINVSPPPQGCLTKFSRSII